jgi:integrase
MSEAEVEGLIEAPDINTEAGICDRTLIILLSETGIRASEIGAIMISDVDMSRTPPTIAIRGCTIATWGGIIAIEKYKIGDRVVKLSPRAAQALKMWMTRTSGHKAGLLFGKMSSKDIRTRLEIVKKTAEPVCPSLAGKHVRPSTLRNYWRTKANVTIRDLFTGRT